MEFIVERRRPKVQIIHIKIYFSDMQYRLNFALYLLHYRINKIVSMSELLIIITNSCWYGDKIR